MLTVGYSPMFVNILPLNEKCAKARLQKKKMFVNILLLGK